MSSGLDRKLFALFQIGYEPIAPQPGKTFLGRPAMVLPNIFQYGNFKENARIFFFSTIKSIE